MHSEMLLDFGLLNMRKGERYLSLEDTERAFLLIRGKVTFVWEGKSVTAERKSCLDNGVHYIFTWLLTGWIKIVHENSRLGFYIFPAYDSIQ